MDSTESFPPLPLAGWESSKQTLHLFSQIVGKIKMQHAIPQIHWWHVTLYVTTQGLGTGPIPFNDHRLEISFNFIDHRLEVFTSKGQRREFALHDGLTVAEFYGKLHAILTEFGVPVNIKAQPYDQPFDTPFAEDHEHAAYDKNYIERYWKILLQNDRIFKIFNRDFYGKSCPVQLYWHSFDLAMTRFSGNKVPSEPNAGKVDREAYSHEVISFGFWAGDKNIPDPAYYSYTYPSPEGLKEAPLKPEKAFWSDQESPLALLMYEDLRTSSDPEESLLTFLDSAYRAGVEKAGWDTSNLHKS